MDTRVSSLLLASSVLLSGCGRPEPIGESEATPPPSPTPGKIESHPLPERPSTEPGQKLFESLDPNATGVDYGMRWDDPGSHLKEFIFLNPAGGICTGDYDGDGLPDFYVTCPSNGGRLYRNLGNFKFEDATVGAGVADEEFWGTGASFVDIDNDGDLDLYVCGYTQANKLYINDGSGRFSDRASEFGLAFDGGSMMMSFADIDNDGDLDGYLATTAVAPPPGTKFQVNFVPRESDGVEIPVVIPELREYWELLYLPGDRVRRVEAGQYDHLFRNDGGKFVDVSRQSGIDGAYFTLSATWLDYDADGDPDLYVSNDYTGPDMLYRNRGDGTFEDVIADAVPHTPWFSMGSDCGDLNNDGMMDLFASDMSATSHYREKVMMGNMDDMGWFLEWATPRQYMRNAVYINSGTGRFQEAAFLAGLSSSDWSWTPRLEDFDQDGHTDVFITNGVMRDNMDSDVSAYSEKAFTPGSPEYVKFWVSRPMRKENNLAFKNRRNLQFDSVGASWGLNHSGVSFGAATADFDGDGDPDLVVSNADRPVSLYRNHSHENHRIAVKLIGKTSNRAGLGATIKLTSAAGIQTRAITSARGWLSASDTTALFGLGDSKMATRLEIVWPGGIRQQFDDLEADHLYSITEPVGQSPLPAKQGVPPIFTESTTLAQAVHRERPYDDFERQPLLPNKLSQLGPGCAWGDIDGDGDDDFFLGGAAGSPGQILLNLGNGTFQPLPEPALASDASSEDMGALFFDCDADGDLDLFVSHGGVEDPTAHPNYRDRLYLNDGQGSFSPAPPDRIPDLRSSSGPLAAADFDRDGDLDLFVGSRVVPGQYPHAPRDSYLLVNAGGNFSAVAIPALGMVTGALWSDADDDGWIDLMLTTEWGSVKFLKNVSGQLVDTSSSAGLDQQLGWWNGISAGDVDGDGDIDYLVSNLGLNTKYRASEKKPSLIYYGDLDGSGKSHIVEAKMGSGKILPRRGFSCSKNAMPSLQAKIGTYHNFASAALADLYTESRLSGALRLEVNTIETGLLLNDGQARFSWRALPRTAQISPSFGSALEDIDADGDLDAILAQNSFSPQRETGRMDGGLSLVLLNDGGGNFSPLTPVASGLAIPGDAQSLTISDLNDDGSPDLIFGMNGAAALSYVNNSDSRQTLSIRLAPNQNCRPAAGAKVRVGPQIRELYAGGGYLSQASSQLYFRQPEGAETATVRWPDGSLSRHPIAIGTSSIVLEQPPPE